MQVIFLILKILGFTLLGILGLLVLVLLSVLFLPIVYRLEGGYEKGTPELRIKIHWMFPILCINGGLDEENKFWYCMRIMGFPFRTNKKKLKTAGEKKPRTKKAKRKRRAGRKQTAEAMKQAEVPKTAESEAEKAAGEDTGFGKEMPALEKKEPDILAENGQSEEKEGILKLEKTAKYGKGKEGQEETCCTAKVQTETKDTEENPNDSKKEPEEKAGKKGRSLFSKIRGAIQKVKNIFLSIPIKIKAAAGKFKKLGDKAGAVVSFFENAKCQRGFRKVSRFLKKVLRHILPGRVSGTVRFGLEDPAATGKLYGALTLFYGWYGDSLSVVPEFEQSIVEGHVKMRGRIVLGVLGIWFLKLWRDKEFKYLLAEARQLKEDL